MAHIKFHDRDGGYRVHHDDGTVEPDVYVSYHQAAGRARALNLIASPQAQAPAPARKRRLRLRRAS